MLWLPPTAGLEGLAANQSSTSTEGITVTGNASIHTKGSWAGTPLWTSTPYDAYGITLLIHNVGTASTNSRMLVDVGIGAAGSETVLIPNLLAGNAAAWNSASNGGTMYHFPLFIPSGVRLNCRNQGLISADVCNVVAYLHQWPTGPDRWVGTRVTDYGTNTGTSSGVAHTPGSTNAYAGSATQITASTTNKIRALQVGIDLGTDTTATSMRGMFRLGLGATPNYFVSDLPFGESTTLESMDIRMANFILSHARFNLPAGSDIRVNAMVSGTGESRGWAIYGVD